jgi:hypothetical protein
MPNSYRTLSIAIGGGGVGSIKNIVGKMPRSQIEVPNESLFGADNEPTEKPPESNSRGSVPLQVVPPQA